MWLPISQESLTLRVQDEGGGSSAARELPWMLWRNKWLILLFLAAGGVAGFLYSQASPPIYRARATVEIQSFNENFLNVRDMDPTGGSYSDDSYFQTQVRIFEGAAVHRRTAEEMLEKLPPEPAPETQPWWKSVFEFSSAPLSPRRAVMMARSSVKVRPVGKARLVEITTASTDGATAAEFLNKLTDAFIEQNLKLRWESAQRTSEWLSRQLDDLRENLAKAERALQDYTRNSGLVIAAGPNAGEAQLRDLQQQLSRADADRAAKQARYEQARSMGAETLPEIMDDATFRAQNTRLEDLRVQLAEASATLAPEHYRVKRLEFQIKEVENGMAANKARILDRIRQEHDAAVRHHDLLKQAYAEQAQFIAGQAEKLAQYNVLKQDVDATRTLYDSLLQRVRESGIASALRASNVRVVEPASAPASPDGPDPVQSTALGLSTGLLIGLALVVGRERLSRNFLKAPGEAPACLPVPELGVIPNEAVGYKRTARFPLLAGHANGSTGSKGTAERELVELATWQKNRSLLAESFRATLTSVLFSNPNAGSARVFVVTSPNPREGKTVIAGNLAVALAEIGRRTLLIDGDLRNPRLHKAFDLPNSVGLSDLVHSTETIEGCPATSLVRATNIPGLFLLPSGPAPMSVSNLLHSPRLAALLRTFRADFDCVLIDTPPMLHLTDARILAKMADGVLLVLRSDHTTREQAQSAVQRLVADGAPVLGTILNDWNPRTRPAGYYGSYSQYFEHASR